MSFQTTSLPKSQLPSSCGICEQGFTSDWSLSNLGRSQKDQLVTVMAHKVKDTYHGHVHPYCFAEQKATGSQPQCSECKADAEIVNNKPVKRSWNIFSSVDNSDETVTRRGYMLKQRIGDPVFWRFNGETSKSDEIRNIINGYVWPLDLSAAAITAVKAKQFDCIPTLIHQGYHYGSELTQDAKDKVFVASAAKHWPTLQALFSLDVTEYAQGKALLEIVKNGNVQNLKEFLKLRATQGLVFDQTTLDKAVEAAAARGVVVEMIQVLLAQGELSETGYAKAINASASCKEESSQCRDTVKLLLGKGHLSGYERSAAFANALASFRFDVAWELTPGYKIPNSNTI